MPSHFLSMQQRFLTRFIPHIVLVVSLSWVYSQTMAPSLTWANGGSDGGDLITAAATGGVAHPSGYPLYLLLARCFQLLPFGSLAFRTNVMSAFFAVLTSLLVYEIIIHDLHSEMGSFSLNAAGLAAAYAISFSPLFWSQAVITEVYTLHAFFLAWMLYIASRPMLADRVRGLVYGLAAGNHITALLVSPIAILTNCVSRGDEATRFSRFSINWKSAGMQFLWLLAGVSIYLTLPLRAAMRPPVNWGNPVNPQNFWRLVSGELYRSHYLQYPFDQLWERTRLGASLLLQQFGYLGILLGFIGVIVFFRLSRWNVLSIWIAVAFCVFASIYQSADSLYYFIPAFLSFSIWIGICVGRVVESVNSRNKVVSRLVALILLIYFVSGAAFHWRGVDASQDHRAEEFGERVFSALPQDAIVFVKGDPAVFELWYFRFALGCRPDLIVIAEDLLHFDWYQETLRATYPSLSITSPFPWPSTIAADNPSHPLCYVQYDLQARVRCTY